MTPADKLEAILPAASTKDQRIIAEAVAEMRGAADQAVIDGMAITLGRNVTKSLSERCARCEFWRNFIAVLAFALGIALALVGSAVIG